MLIELLGRSVQSARTICRLPAWAPSVCVTPSRARVHTDARFLAMRKPVAGAVWHAGNDPRASEPGRV